MNYCRAEAQPRELDATRKHVVCSTSGERVHEDVDRCGPVSDGWDYPDDVRVFRRARRRGVPADHQQHMGGAARQLHLAILRRLRDDDALWILRGQLLVARGGPARARCVVYDWKRRAASHVGVWRVLPELGPAYLRHQGSRLPRQQQHPHDICCDVFRAL